MAGQSHHILLNGLSIATGGGVTVGWHLSIGLAHLEPGWRVTLLLTQRNPVHEELRARSRPDNLDLHWAPPATRRLFARWRYERSDLPALVRREAVGAVVQLNGMLVPGLPVPSLCHFQDPWPYRTLIHYGLRRRVTAFLKRRQHAYAMRHAPSVGFTSEYLKDLYTHYHGITPRRTHVFPNGLPTEWLIRAEQPFTPWRERPLEILTVGSVADHKRQHLVVEAMPDLVKRPGLSALTYRILGHAWWKYEAQVRSLAQRLGVDDRVVFEGRVSEQRIREAYESARAFVFMSVCESFGIPLIEAMSLGTPVVAARCCALPEVVADAAVLVEPDDRAGLVDVLARLLGDAVEAEDLQERGRRRLAQFRWSSTAEAVRNELVQLMEGKTGRVTPR